MGTQEYNEAVGALEEISGDDSVEGDDEVGANKGRGRRVRVPRTIMTALRKADPTGRLWSVGVRLPNVTAQVAVAAAGTSTLDYQITLEGTILRGVSWSPELDIYNLTLANEPLSPQGAGVGMYVFDPRVDRAGLDPLEGLKVPMNAKIGGTVINPTADPIFFRLDLIIWTGKIPNGRTIREMAGG